MSTDEGVVIKSFSPEYESVYSGEKIRLLMEIENVGETSAEAINVNLHGFGNIDTKAVSVMGPATKESAGDFYDFEWNIDAPPLTEGISNNYDVLGRLEYNYKTNAFATIKVIGLDQSRRGFEQELVEVINTRGPVKIEVSGETVIIKPNTDNRYAFRITFRNVGNGVPIGNGVEEIGQMNVAVALKAKAGTFLGSCVDKELTPENEQTSTGNTIRLRNGESITKSCVIFFGSEWNNVIEDIVSLDITASYRYAVEKYAQVEVKGVRK